MMRVKCQTKGCDNEAMYGFIMIDDPNNVLKLCEDCRDEIVETSDRIVAEFILSREDQ
jgi:hypothetical protein